MPATTTAYARGTSMENTLSSLPKPLVLVVEDEA